MLGRAELVEHLKQPRVLADLVAGCVTVLGLVGCFNASPVIKTFSLSLLLGGVGSLGANTLMATLYAETAATVLDRELERARTELELVERQLTQLTARSTELQGLWEQGDNDVQSLKTRLQQVEAEKGQVWQQAQEARADFGALQSRFAELAEQYQTAEKHVVQVLAEVAGRGQSALVAAVGEWREGLLFAIDHTLKRRPDIAPRLEGLRDAVTQLAAKYEQQIAEVQPGAAAAHPVEAVLRLIQQAATEFSALKVRYRNTLNVGDAIRYQAQIAGYEVEVAELKAALERLGKDSIPRSQHESILSEFLVKKDAAFEGLMAQTESLEKELQSDTDQYVQKLIGQLEQATREIAALKARVEELSQPQTFAPATRDDLRMGNVVIGYFEALGVILDRAYSDYRKWEAVLYVHTDRNRKVILASELNEHSERLQPLLNCLNVPKFEYDAEQGLMRVRVQIASKPKADASEIHKLWKRADQFPDLVKAWERVRITGGSESGKSPTAENLAVCILEAHPGVVKLANPMHDSQKNYWSIPVTWRSHKEALSGLKELAASVERRAAGEEFREPFVLYLFDEVDSTIEANRAAAALIKTAIKQASHQNLGAIFIGQNANVSNYKGMDRSDWNNAVNLHIGANAYDAITNSNQFTTKEQNELKERADRLTEFCVAKNQELGFEARDPEAYRFALVIEPNKKPYFIELPPFGRYPYAASRAVCIQDASLASSVHPAASDCIQEATNPSISVASRMPSTPYVGSGCPKCETGTLTRVKRNRSTRVYICDACGQSTSESILQAQAEAPVEEDVW